MEVQGASKNKVVVCLFEMLGTALLVTALNWTGNDPFAMGAVLFVLYNIFGSVSGGHFNPAVTMGVLTSMLISGSGGGRQDNLIFAAMLILS